ncbi:Ff.00g039510.m01.CDS01 [Fusarium sp. VM40]|nr:Ff.00g039510.m01.CDS01 [Fusarium sp. VM40]
MIPAALRPPNRLWKPVEEGREEDVRRLLRNENIDINGQDRHHRTLLLIAAGLSSSNIFIFLLEKDDTRLNTKDREGNTPLSLAVRNGHEDIVSLLLAKDKIDVNPRDIIDCTPLHAAAFHGHEAITKLLLDRHDIEMNPRNTTNDTPLHESASNGHETVSRLLLARDGVDLNSRNIAGYTPLFRALYGGHGVVAELLLDHAGMDFFFSGSMALGYSFLSKALENGLQGTASKILNTQISNNSEIPAGRSPLTWAAEKDRTDPMQLILRMTTIDPNSYDADGRTPLSRAAENNSVSAVHMLLGNSRIDVDFKDLDSRTPLSRAIENKHNIVVSILAGRDTVTLHSLVREGNLPLMEILLDNGFKIDTRDSEGQTSLHLAISHNHFDIAEKLLSRGADINAEDSSLTRPLSLAIRLKRCNFADLLLRNCACIRGIKVESWRALYTRIPPQFDIYISERASGARRVDFSNTADVLVNRSGIERLLCLTSTYEAWWLSMDRTHGMWIPSPTTLSSLENTMRMVSNYRHDSKHSTAFAIALVPSFQLDLKMGHIISWEGCGVGWTLDDFKRSSGSTGKTKDHRYYSMLQDSWIPDDGIELFEQFLAPLTTRWLDLCDQFEEHLSRLRFDQLESHGKRPETISLLAENALHIAKLRRSLQGQVRGARQFTMNLVQYYGTGREQEMVAKINVFADVGQQLQSLDQTVRDLLQLEFAWVSINEAHKSTSLATSMKRLSWITFIFLPAMFAASLFGMNVDILEGNPDWWWYLLFMGSLLFLTTAGWLFAKYLEVESWIEAHVGEGFRVWLGKENT